MNVDATATLVDGRAIALVCVVVENPAPVPRRARLRNRLGGPLLPPRSAGLPERPWNEEVATVVVPGGGHRALGYACPLASAPEATTLPESPVELVKTERAGGPEREGSGRSTVPGGSAGLSVPRVPESTADAAVRRLGRPEPPRDAVPDSKRTPVSDEGGTDCDGPDGGHARTDCDEPDGGHARTGTGGDDRESGGGRLPEAREPDAAAVPPATAAWLDRVAERIAVAEALDDPPLAAAAGATAAAGGIDGIRAVASGLAGDAAALGAVSDRAATLARRAERAEPSVRAIESIVGVER